MTGLVLFVFTSCSTENEVAPKVESSLYAEFSLSSDRITLPQYPGAQIQVNLEGQGDSPQIGSLTLTSSHSEWVSGTGYEASNGILRLTTANGDVLIGEYAAKIPENEEQSVEFRIKITGGSGSFSEANGFMYMNVERYTSNGNVLPTTLRGNLAGI